MDVSLEEAYAEACRMLGEAMVRERLTVLRLSARQEPAQDPLVFGGDNGGLAPEK